MNRKASIQNIFTIGGALVAVGIIALIIVLMSAVWIHGFGIMTTELIGIEGQFANGENISEYTTITFGSLDTAFQQLRFFSFAIIFGLIIGVFVSNFLVRAHPAFFGLYLFVASLAVVFSIFISNAYEKLLGSGTAFADTLTSFGGSSWLLLYLPLWTTVIAFVGGIFLFVAISRDSEQGGIV